MSGGNSTGDKIINGVKEHWRNGAAGLIAGFGVSSVVGWLFSPGEGQESGVLGTIGRIGAQLLAFGGTLFAFHELKLGDKATEAASEWISGDKAKKEPQIFEVTGTITPDELKAIKQISNKITHDAGDNQIVVPKGVPLTDEQRDAIQAAVKS